MNFENKTVTILNSVITIILNISTS